MTNSGRQPFTSTATRMAPARFSGATCADAAADGFARAAELGAGPASTGSTRLHPTHPASHRSKHARDRINSPLFGKQIAERPELGGFGDAGAVLLVGSLFGIFLEGAQ